MTHVSQDLDDTVHQRTRLGILVVLAEGKRVQFGFLQETLGLTDGNLSRHVEPQLKRPSPDYAIALPAPGRIRPGSWHRICRRFRATADTEVVMLRGGRFGDGPRQQCSLVPEVVRSWIDIALSRDARNMARPWTGLNGWIRQRGAARDTTVVVDVDVRSRLAGIADYDG